METYQGDFVGNRSHRVSLVGKLNQDKSHDKL